VVLFSPGGTSYDEFKDFEERGEFFKKWVLELS
jgi:UDP-N-acetylmuramoylalanine--D-glutamate ligase